MDEILKEIDKKMKQLLDNQMKICYNYSSMVMIKYKSLLTILNTGMVDDFSSILEIIEELKEIVLKEYEVYGKLLEFNKTDLIAKIDVLINGEDNSLEYMRFKNRLQFTKNIFCGYKISSEELPMNIIPEKMEFDIYSAILTSISITTFGNIKEKLDSLEYDNDKDKLFVKLLYDELNSKLLYRICCNDSFELIALSCNMDIERFPSIDMNYIKQCLSKIYYNTCIDEHFNEVLYNIIVDDISVMKDIKDLENSPEDVFKYLYLITKIDVILSYLDNMWLRKLYNSCNEFVFNNTYISCDVKRKIKNKING